MRHTIGTMQPEGVTRRYTSEMAESAVAFEKFLDKLAIGNIEPKAKAKGPGRPRLPPEERKYPQRITERHQENGRIKRGTWKGKGGHGCKHYKVKRKRARISKARNRAKHGIEKDLAYNKTLKRKYEQNRSIARLQAKKRGINPDEYYQVTYEQWLQIWASPADVFHDNSFQRPAAIANNPLIYKKNCCYFRRIDEKKGFTLDNVAVFYRGKPLTPA